MTTLQTTHHEGSIRPRGKNSRFIPPSGVFGVKHGFICVSGLRKNLRSPVYGKPVVVAVTLAIGGNGFKMTYFSHSTRTVSGLIP